MEINDIKIFFEVAQLQSTVKASNKLGYVQSNISKRISKLETELGKPLFHRTNKGMTLTTDGELFLLYANKILTTVSDIESTFQTKKKTVCLGATQSISKNYLQDFYFDDTITIFTDIISSLTQKLKECQIDFMIVNREISDTAIKTITTIQESLFWTQANKSETDFLNNKIIVSRDTECPYRKETMRYLINHQVEREALIEVDTLDILLSLLEEKGTMAILPEKTIALHTNLEAIAIPDNPNTTIYVYALKSNSMAFDIDLV